jgi:hypothetical protein
MRVPAYLTRTGVFKYSDPNGNTVAEYRPPEEVFHADSLASVADAPVTVGHVGMVSPDNHAQLSAGHVRDIRQDGDKVAGTVVLQGRKAIRAVEKGVREVSCGYVCRTDETPGIAPDGTPYDRVQRDIRINHLALVNVGRAGPEVRLRLDAADDQIPLEEPKMSDGVKQKVEKFDGVEYDADSEQLAHAKKLTGEVTKLTAKLDAAEADKAKLALEVAALKDPARLDAAVTARAALVDSARKVLGAETKFDGLSDMAIKSAVVAKAYPAIKLDEKSTERTDALFEAAMVGVEAVATAQRADAAAHGAVRQSLVAGALERNDGMPDVEAAYEAMVKREQNRWKNADKAKA